MQMNFFLSYSQRPNGIRITSHSYLQRSHMINDCAIECINQFLNSIIQKFHPEKYLQANNDNNELGRIANKEKQMFALLNELPQNLSNVNEFLTLLFHIHHTVTFHIPLAVFFSLFISYYIFPFIPFI